MHNEGEDERKGDIHDKRKGSGNGTGSCEVIASAKSALQPVVKMRRVVRFRSGAQQGPSLWRLMSPAQAGGKIRVIRGQATG